MSGVPSKPATLVLAVSITCLVAAWGLAATYGVTADRIAEQDRLAQERSLQSALPDAAGFEPIADEALIAQAQAVAGEVQVRGIFKALDAQGEDAGWGVRFGSRGYSGYVQLVVGLDADGAVTGVAVLRHAETPGLGTKVMANPEYLAQFKSLPEGFTIKDVRKIDAIAGATKSSNSVKNAIKAAGAIHAEVLSRGGE